MPENFGTWSFNPLLNYCNKKKLSRAETSQIQAILYYRPEGSQGLDNVAHSFSKHFNKFDCTVSVHTLFVRTKTKPEKVEAWIKYWMDYFIAFQWVTRFLFY